MASSVAPTFSHSDPSRSQVARRTTISMGPLIQKRTLALGRYCQAARMISANARRADTRPAGVARAAASKAPPPLAGGGKGEGVLDLAPPPPPNPLPRGEGECLCACLCVTPLKPPSPASPHPSAHPTATRANERSPQ